jgi:hypothetical protein
MPRTPNRYPAGVPQQAVSLSSRFSLGLQKAVAMVIYHSIGTDSNIGKELIFSIIVFTGGNLVDWQILGKPELNIIRLSFV